MKEWLLSNADLITLISTVLGIGGALFAFYKYFQEQKKSNEKANQLREQAANESAENALAKREANYRQWQKTAVLGILSASQQKDMSLDDIRMRYLPEIQSYTDYDVPKTELSKGALQRVMLELTSVGAVVRTSSDRFALKVERENPIEKHAIQMNEDAIKNQVVTTAMVRKVAKRPAHYTRRDLVRSLVDEEGLELYRVGAVVSTAIAQNLLVVQPEENYCVSLATDIADFRFNPNSTVQMPPPGVPMAMERTE